MYESPSNRRNRPVLTLVTAHWLSELGLGLVVTAFVTWLILLPVRLEHGEENPYIGIVAERPYGALERPTAGERGRRRSGPGQNSSSAMNARTSAPSGSPRAKV